MIITVSIAIKITGQIIALVIPLYNYFSGSIDSTGVKIKVEDLGKIDDIIDYIFNNTKADRFILFFGTNGWSTMKFATAFLEKHKNINKDKGIINKYVKLDVDDYYLSLIKSAEKNGAIDLQLDDMSSCDLKSIYKKEGI